MKLSYRVHRVSKHPYATSVTLPNGEKSEGVIPALEVELVAIGHFGGTIMHRFIGRAVGEAEQVYREGKTIIAEFLPSSDGQ